MLPPVVPTESMTRRDVPNCFRTPLSVALAERDGYKAGKMLLPADVMPERYRGRARDAWLAQWNAGRKAVG